MNLNDNDNKQIVTKIVDNVYFIQMNRPSKSNAYDQSMAIELKQAFFEVKKREDLHVVVLTGKGQNFCTGADLEWMAKVQNLSDEENLIQMRDIKEMYLAMNRIEIPIVGMVQGKVRGGGVGLVAGCDLVLCEAGADFSLSEVKLGLIPGMSSPFIISKIGPSYFLELSLSGRVIKANEAQVIGLVHSVCDTSEMEKVLMATLEQLKLNAVGSQKMIKLLLKSHASLNLEEELQKMLLASAKMRKGQEFQERFKKFMQAKQPQ